MQKQSANVIEFLASESFPRFLYGNCFRIPINPTAVGAISLSQYQAQNGGSIPMGRTLANKQEIIEDLKQSLSQTQMALVIDYAGLSVAEITELRNRLRPTGSECKVTKNTLMRKAVEADAAWEPMQEFLGGTSAFIFAKDDLGAAIKAYESFQKDTKKTELRGGVMEGRALSLADVKAITELPTKEELIARIAGAINSIPTQLAVGTKAVPTKLAVGIKEVPGQLVRAIHAVSEQQKGDSEAA